jgi:hypothetical protein
MAGALGIWAIVRWPKQDQRGELEDHWQVSVTEHGARIACLLLRVRKPGRQGANTRLQQPEYRAEPDVRFHQRGQGNEGYDTCVAAAVRYGSHLVVRQHIDESEQGW